MKDFLFEAALIIKMHFITCLAVVGGFIGQICIDVPAVEFVSKDVLQFLSGLAYACIYAAAGWSIKYLLDSWKKNGFKFKFKK